MNFGGDFLEHGGFVDGVPDHASDGEQNNAEQEVHAAAPVSRRSL
ncbi:hypothetical protein [Paenarthrobacter nitroguajacolicus]|nr:hypothetical protein [Paenarthrobacter nitroguajacolicus]